MKSTIAALALQIGTVLGAPASSIIPALSARDDDYIYGPNEGESARIAYGDSNFRFGHLVPSSTLDVIRDQCSDLGCDAGQTFEHTAFMVNSDVGRDVGITMTVDTEFNGVSSEDRPGSKAHLLALAKAAFEEVYESGAGTREEGVVYTKDPCPPSQVHGCPGQSGGYTDQWTSTNSIHIRVNAKDDDGKVTDALAGSLKIKFTMSDDSSSNGLCAALGAAGAGAGLANKWAGFGVGLASIICGELSG